MWWARLGVDCFRSRPSGVMNRALPLLSSVLAQLDLRDEEVGNLNAENARLRDENYRPRRV